MMPGKRAMVSSFLISRTRGALETRLLIQPLRGTLTFISAFVHSPSHLSSLKIKPTTWQIMLHPTNTCKLKLPVLLDESELSGLYPVCQVLDAL